MAIWVPHGAGRFLNVSLCNYIIHGCLLHYLLELHLYVDNIILATNIICSTSQVLNTKQSFFCVVNTINSIRNYHKYCMYKWLWKLAWLLVNTLNAHIFVAWFYCMCEAGHVLYQLFYNASCTTKLVDNSYYASKHMRNT